MFILNGDTISWKSSKQKMIIDSIIELEYIVSFDGNLWKGFGPVSSVMN